MARSPTSTLVCWIGSQGVPKVACFALVAVVTSCVVDALETPACQVVTVPGGTGVHVVVALTGLTRSHWAPFPKGVPKVAIGTELAAGTWKEQVVTYRQQDRRRGQSAPTRTPGAGAQGTGWALLSPGVTGLTGVRTGQPCGEAPRRQRDGSGKVRFGARLPRLLLKTDQQREVALEGRPVCLHLGSFLKTEFSHEFCLKTSPSNHKPPATVLDASSPSPHTQPSLHLLHPSAMTTAFSFE